MRSGRQYRCMLCWNFQTGIFSFKEKIHFIVVRLLLEGFVPIIIKCCQKCGELFCYFTTKVKVCIEKSLTMLDASSEYKLEILSMQRALPTLSYTLKHSMGHRLRAKIQLTAFNDLKEKIKSDQEIALLVMDRKQRKTTTEISKKC